jgi:fibronectin-binding autotransporter adhesin
MNTPTIKAQAAAGVRSRKSYSAAVAALAAAMLALGASDLQAAGGTWAGTADLGAGLTVTNAGSALTFTDTVSGNAATLVEGDAVLVGLSPVTVLGSTFSYYYAVGVGSTPDSVVRLATSPSGNTFAPAGTSQIVSKVPTWFSAGNWTGGIIPNGIDDSAIIAPVAPVAPQNAMTTLLVDRNLTIGSLSVDTTNCGPHATDTTPAGLAGTAGSFGLSLIGSSRTAGLLSTLTFQTSTGTPTVEVSGGKSLSFSDSKVSGGTVGNAAAKLTVAGNQGLIINNLNPVSAPVAVDALIVAPATSPFTYGGGQVRFGLGLDWSNFSGDLTLAQGVFQPLGGGSTGNGFSSLPLNSKLVLGTGSNVARLEIPTNSANNGGSTLVRGLESTSPNSSIINTRQLALGTGVASATFEVGSYGAPSDSFTYAGNIGDSTHSASLASASAIRFVKIGPGTQTLSGVNNLNALAANTVVVAVLGGKLSLGTTGAIGTITNGQGAANADSSFVLKNGEFALSGLGNSTAARTQSFGGQLISGNVAPATSNPDFNQSTQSTSFSTLTVTADPAQPASLSFGSLRSRNNGSNWGNLNGTTFLYRGTNLGALPGPGVATINFTTAPTAGNGLSSTGVIGTSTAPVLKGALADTSPAGTGTGFATYDATKGVRLLESSEQNIVTTGAAYNAAATNENTVLNLSSDDSITGHASNTLKINNSTGSTITLTNSGTALNPANGLLFSGTSPIVLSGGTITGTVNTDAEDVVIHSINNSEAGITLRTPVSNACTTVGSSARQGWVTYSGPGNLRIEGDQTVGIVGLAAVNTVGGIAFNGTGTTTLAAPLVNAATFNVNQGLVKLDIGAAWSNAPRLMLASGATFDFNGITSNATTNRFTDISAPITANGALALNAGGVVTNTGASAVDLRLSGNTNGALNAPFFGTIAGNLNLVVDKSTFNTVNSTFAYGIQSLANVNTYTGATNILSGILNIARGGQLPPTTVVTLGTSGSDAIATLSLGDSNNAGAVRQTIAGLYEVGNGASLVRNNGAMVSQLTLNIPQGIENIYSGDLGVTPAANGSGENLFGLRKIGAGTFEASGSVVYYTGGTVIQGGILRVSSDAKLGQIGSLTGAAGGSGALAPQSAFANNIILDGGTLQTTTTANFTLDTKRGIGLGPTEGSTGGTGTLWVDSGINLTYGGVIASAGNTGTQTLVKNGSGHLALNGANTFTGTTTVAAGSLGGTGSLASGVSVSSGAALAPGNGGVGTFAIGGGLTLATGAQLTVDLDAPGTSDLIQLGGALNASGSATINVNPLAGFAAGTYTLISGSAPLGTTNLKVGTLPVGFRGTLASVGNTVTLTIAPGSALTALESWRQDNFGNSDNSGTGADAADYDHDGVANLVEYATGSDPKIAGAATYSTARAGNFLALTYTRIADPSLTYTVEGSNDLVTWTTVSTSNNPSTGAANLAGPVTVTDTVSTVGTPRRFLRMKVGYSSN